MSEKRYLIEILIRAREQVTQAAQKAAQALDGVSKAQDQNTAASKRASDSNNSLRKTLEDLREAHLREKKAAEDTAAAERRSASTYRQTADAYRQRAQAVRQSTDAQKQQLAVARQAHATALEELGITQQLAEEQKNLTGQRSKAYTEALRDVEAQRREVDVKRRAMNAVAASTKSVERCF
jgi:hypothetical protein